MDNMCWYQEDQRKALSQGWGIFAVDGNQNNLEIQRDDESEIFPSDDFARGFVFGKAFLGDFLCKKAQEFIKENQTK